MTNKDLMNKLVEMDQLITINRIWGGMDWIYGPIPAFRTKKLAELMQSLLDEFASEEKQKDFDVEKWKDQNL